MSDQALNGWKRIGGYQAGYQDGLAESGVAFWTVSTAISLISML